MDYDDLVCLIFTDSANENTLHTKKKLVLFCFSGGGVVVSFCLRIHYFFSSYFIYSDYSTDVFLPRPRSQSTLTLRTRLEVSGTLEFSVDTSLETIL